jgi:hypothetical protein
MSFMLGLYPAASSRAKSAVSENRDEGVLVGEQDYRQENRDRIKELRQEFQQRQEAHRSCHGGDAPGHREAG